MTAAEGVSGGLEPVLRLERVVVGVDGSEPAGHAARWAAQEAVDRSVPLTVLHALGLSTETLAPPFGLITQREHVDAEAERLVESVAEPIRRAYPDAAVETEIYPGPAAQRLVELSGPETLTVTGTRGHGAFAGVLLGSVSRVLTTHARGPLVVVRRPRAEVPDAVVLGVGPDPDESAIEYAFDAAGRCGVGVNAVRTIAPRPVFTGEVDLPVLRPAGQGIRSSVPPLIEDVRADREQEIEREFTAVGQAIDAATRRYPQVPVEVTVWEGDPPEILTALGELARLVVIGAPAGRHRRILPATPGHVVGRLLAHCPAPVAVIPGPGENQ